MNLKSGKPSASDRTTCRLQPLPLYAGYPQMRKAYKIHLIEDDELVREATEMFIQSLGYDVEAFASAEDYLSAGCVRDAACLISDVHMPGMSGADLQMRLIGSGLNIPIIFVTGDGDELLRARMIAAGALAVLSKPVDKNSFIRCIAMAFDAGTGYRYMSA